MEESTEFRFGVDIDVHTDDEEIAVQHMRVKKIENLEKCKHLKRLSIVASCVSELERLDNNTELQELEVYQGLLSEIRNIGHLTQLRVLDLSFNNIKKMENLGSLVNLEKLFLSNNKISEIQGLENMTKLKVLELGSNNIRSLDAECLGNLTELEELWLGKNKITSIKGKFSEFRFPRLKQLSLQSNRLTEWNPLLFSHVAPNLENAYFGSNQLPDMDRDTLEAVNPDSIAELDLSYNCLTQVPQFPRPMHRMQELWLNDNKMDFVDSLTTLSRIFPSLRTIYIERNPVHRSCSLDCRNTILRNAPQTLEQIDATMIPKHELLVASIPVDKNTVKPILKQ
jgi:protein phosphatase 1 regulatory subunit 7